MELPPSLWPRLYSTVLESPWPPSDAGDALAFVRAARKHRLLPLLISIPDLPESVRTMLPVVDAVYQRLIERTELQLEVLSRLASVLDDEPLILLKGCDYRFRLYPRPELRPSADIDFLIPRARSKVVIERLREAGAQQAFPGGRVSRLSSYHETFFRLGDVTIEPHNSFAQRVRFAIDYEGIWERRVPFAAGPLHAFRLADEDAILYAALSLSLDHFDAPLIKYLDFYLLLDRFRGDLSIVAGRARQWLIERAFFSALDQTSQVFPEIKHKVEPALNSLLSACDRRFLRERVLPPPMAGRHTRRPEQLWRKFHLMDRYRERVVFLLYHGYAIVAGAALSMTTKRTDRASSVGASDDGT